VAGLARLSQADVLVCARGGGGMLRERMSLVRALWDAGLAAELLPQAAPSLTDQYEYAQTRGIPWLVIINAATFEGEPSAAAWLLGWGAGQSAGSRTGQVDQWTRTVYLLRLCKSALDATNPGLPHVAAADTVRVKAVAGRLEEDVAVPDLPAYLQTALHPHGAAASATTRPLLHVGSRAAEEADEEAEEAPSWRERQRRGGRR
jgi:histidyl-tRNA synthetase